MRTFRGAFRLSIGLAALACAFGLRAEIVNVAGDGIAYADRTLYSNWPISRLIDQDTTTVFHADTDDQPGLNYSVDLGRNQSITELRIFPRQDTCCASRLKNFRVSVHAEAAGAVGAEVWGQSLYTDGTDPGSGPGIVVKIPLPQPQTGRWIKVEALDNPPADYSLQMTELQVFADVPAAQVNRALNKVASANQALNGNPSPQGLVDGNRSVPLHGAEVLTPGFAYTINLGSSVKLDHIVLWARQDGCCAERLSNYRVSVLKDNAGQPGAVAWKADLHTDGSNPGSEVGSQDVLTAALNPAGDFRGQWLRVESLDDPVPPYALQITEIEAYGVPEGAANVLINKQPVAAAAGIARTVNFEVGTVVVNGDAAQVRLQWKKNGTAIPDATNAVYTTPPVLVADDKAKFQCVISYPGLADQLSDEVTLRVNLAYRADATVNRPLWPNGGWSVSMITDGDRGLAIHGDQSSEAGFEYTVNLGAGVKLDEVDIYPRQDGCCGERLLNFQVSVHSDNQGAPGPLNWSADFYTDGSHADSGPGAIVRVTPGLDANPAHKFEGQWLRIHSLDDPEPAYAMQLSEIEAFGTYLAGNPVLSFITQAADIGTVPGRSAHLAVVAKVINGDPTKLTYQWYRAGVLIPGATEGTYVTPPLLPADDGALFHCVVGYPGVSNLTSRDAKVFFDGNYAKNQPITSNRPLWGPGGWNVGMLVDGSRAVAVHSDTAPGAGLAYELDLGLDVTVEHIDIYPRQDGCCAERLANFRVAVLADNNGVAGTENWHADLFTEEGTNAGAGDGVVVKVVKGDGTGNFHGRWVRIQALDKPVKDYFLQISELEVYGSTQVVVVAPTLSFSRVGGTIVIQYANGVLEAATKVGDAWVPVPGAVSPYTVPTAAGNQFFRVRQ